MQPSSRPVVVRSSPPSFVRALMDDGMEALPARILAARGIRRRADAIPPLSTLPPPTLFAGINDMTHCLARAINNAQKIVVVGDYDVDGIGATTIAVLCLRRLGGDVDWFIPERRRDGYGLSPAIVEKINAEGGKLILTADNGISAHAAIARARELGICVCVTDHHYPNGDNNADHVLNPRLNSSAELNNLCGAGVVFYLMAALRQQLRQDVNLTDFLDIVALATVADCTPMDAVNRTFVGAGINRLRRGMSRPGILALCGVMRLDLKSLTCRDIGFRLAPRLNAAGRMDCAHEAMACLLAADDDTAQQKAQLIEKANTRRVDIQKNTLAEAMQRVDPAQRGIVITNPEWDAGIIGIVAGRLSSHFNLPALVFCRHAGVWRGSARAPAGYNLYQLFSAVKDADPCLIREFGGHAQAAGISIDDKQITRFSDAFLAVCDANQVPPAPLEVDESRPQDITRNAVQQLEAMVWGVDFPPPVFADSFNVVGARVVGGKHTQMTLAQNDKTFDAIQFNATPPTTTNVTLLYSVGINSYNNKPQLLIEKTL